MPIQIHKNHERGHVDHGWLKAIHSFSFARFVNEKRMQFGALQVLNEDRIAPGAGFGEHFHDNMEIVTIPLSGVLHHQDSMGNSSIIQAGDIQIMSAGTGILHSEKNASATEPVHLLQIWIIPNESSLPTRYEQMTLDQTRLTNIFQTVIAQEPTAGALTIRQHASFKLGNFEAGKTFVIPVTPPTRGVYLFVITGEVEFNDQKIQTGDALAIWEEQAHTGTVTETCQLLLIEVPLA